MRKASQRKINELLFNIILNISKRAAYIDYLALMANSEEAYKNINSEITFLQGEIYLGRDIGDAVCELFDLKKGNFLFDYCEFIGNKALNFRKYIKNEVLGEKTDD